MSEVALRMRLGRVSAQLRCIAANLQRLGYRFHHPERVLPGVEPGTDEAIARIERYAGSVPLALRLFWSSVGSVDLTGHHPDWHGCDYPDPVVVYPPSVAVAELDEFLGDLEEASKCGGRYLIPVAPDALHKANVSGGMWYNIDVPATGDDPRLNDEPHATTFVPYLELAVACGGFPGLDDGPGHDWPLTQIKQGA